MVGVLVQIVGADDADHDNEPQKHDEYLPGDYIPFFIVVFVAYNARIAKIGIHN
jgi:hypothetical protein